MIDVLAATGDGVARPEPLERVPALLAAGETVWVDLTAPTRDEALAVLDQLLHLHPLAVEDCLAALNHPKIDDYGDYLYLVVHGVVRDERGAVQTAELDCFLGRGWVVTYHDVPFSNVDEIRRRAREVPGFMGRGADWLLHSIVDRLADTFLDLIERLDDEIDTLERSLFSNGGRRAQARIFAVKSDVLRLKRVVHPARDVYGRIARGEYAVVRPEVAPHFRDVYDHILRVAEMLESFRDVTTSALETYLSILSQRTNDVVKVLTVLSAVLMTASLIAGIYGMNFTHIPFAHHPLGFWGAIGAMVVATAVLLWFFRRRRWI